MTSKQEKLAAARKKLKEFQGKYRETEASRQKLSSHKLSSHSSPVFIGNENVENNYIYSSGKDGENVDESNPERRVSFGYSDTSNSPLFWQEKSPPPGGDFNRKLKDLQQEPKNMSSCEISDINKKEYVLLDNEDEIHSSQANNIMRSKENQLPFPGDNSKEFFNNNYNQEGVLTTIIKPLQEELQNHAQTINILVQQRNDTQNALTQTQNLLAEKSGEVENLKQHVTYLNSSLNILKEKILESEGIIQKLNAEKEENLEKHREAKTNSEALQARLEGREEEFGELRKKYEEKEKEFQTLLADWNKSQSQISLYQIQLQQLSSGEHSSLTVKVSELEKENSSLKQRIEDLERRIEENSAEREQSSQKFHIYAQQCNTQITDLNSQLKTLRSENERLIQENSILAKNYSDLESAKEKESSSQHLEVEIGDLHNQISSVTEENNALRADSRQKEEELKSLQLKFEEKVLEIKQLDEILKDLEEENRKLQTEAENPKANERLLATMESDKVAAAKAVSQNQKLKSQILELESAFMKMSQEKLELTDQLSHERHINSELQKLVKTGHDHDHHDHHDHDSECQHENSDPLINDSNEVEELRSIVRQLQEDKMELKERLNSMVGLETKNEETPKEPVKSCNHERHCEDTKLLLQQMEEKVRKTMNEIAVLDEEKEKLEHLVLQLQGETETIGEYITLYQKQRMLLRQRAQEKDNQLMQLSKDKEELRSKLASLDELVQHFIAERQNLQPGPPLPEVPDNTAGKIRALINEIGSTTLVSSHSVVFEHCSCCSGRLINI